MILPYSQLCEMSGYDKPADVVGWLEENEILYFTGKYKRPVTTMLAVNTALGVVSEAQEKEQTRQVRV